MFTGIDLTRVEQIEYELYRYENNLISEADFQRVVETDYHAQVDALMREAGLS
jgi:hypothetical protein